MHRLLSYSMMRSHRSWAWAALLTTALACDPASFEDAGALDASDGDAALEDTSVPADLDGFIRYQMEAGGIPGLAFAIVTADEVVQIRTYGFANIEHAVPVDERTLFILASVSKTAVAIRAQQLVEAGMLDLDAPVSTYLPWTLAHPEHPGAEITTRMLLAHVAGMEDQLITLGQLTFTGDPPVDLAAFAEGYATVGGEYYDTANWGAAPASARSYCNAAYGVLGYVLERAGGASFREQTEANVFAPIGMDDVGWHLADVELSSIATPYAGSTGHFAALDHNGFAYYPASSLRASVASMARYARMILRGGELDGARVLTQESVDAMLTPQYPELSEAQAMAFSERRINGVRYIGHGGSTLGGSTTFQLRRDLRHGIVLLTNSDAHIRARLGLPEGGAAMAAILSRLQTEAAAL